MTERKSLSLLAGAAIVAHRLVKLDASGDAVYNTVTDTDQPIGVNEINAKAAGDVVGIKPLNAEGTVEICAGGAIARAALVYADDDGKVTAIPAGAGDYLEIGQAMGAASGDGSIIEVLVNAGKVVTVT